MLSGTVVRKAEHGFVLKAGAPKAAAGHELLINVQWEKGEGDNWRPVPVHVRFVEGLKPGDETKIEVVNDEGDRLHILELP